MKGNISKVCYNLKKPSIAHRDIKSKNILVTENLACVVADFRMAVTQNDIKDMISSKYEDSDTKRPEWPVLLKPPLRNAHMDHIFNIIKTHLLIGSIIIILNTIRW